MKLNDLEENPWYFTAKRFIENKILVFDICHMCFVFFFNTGYSLLFLKVGLKHSAYKLEYSLQN